MSYLGSAPQSSAATFAGVYSQAFNGDGSTTAFTLGRYVAQAANIEVIVNNVQQSPFDGSYSLSGGTSLVFSEAPSSGSNNIYVIYRDYPVQTLTDTGAVRKSGDTMSGALNFTGGGGSSPVQIKQTMFGYSSSYSVLQLGTQTNGQTVSLFVDPLSNSSGSFNGNGNDLLVPQDFSFISPTASNTTFKNVMNFADGIVMVPNQPAFRARANAATYNADTVINYQNVYLNRGGHYNSSNSTFTAPVGGAYLFGGMTRLDINTAYVYTEIYINGTRLYQLTNELSGLTTTGFSSFTAGSFQIIVTLAAGDSVRCGFGCNSSTATINGQTHWYGYLLG